MYFDVGVQLSFWEQLVINIKTLDIFPWGSLKSMSNSVGTWIVILFFSVPFECGTCCAAPPPCPSTQEAKLGYTDPDENGCTCCTWSCEDVEGKIFPMFVSCCYNGFQNTLCFKDFEYYSIFVVIFTVPQ